MQVENPSDILRKAATRYAASEADWGHFAKSRHILLARSVLMETCGGFGGEQRDEAEMLLCSSEVLAYLNNDGNWHSPQGIKPMISAQEQCHLSWNIGKFALSH